MKNKKKLSKSAKITICAVSGLSVATSIIVPTAVILAKNNPDENIVTIDYNIKGLESGTVKVKAETKVKDLQLEPIEGYAFKGWYKDEACTIRYNLDEVVTHNSTIFAKLEVITYAVIFPTSEFFTVSQTSAIVNYGESLSFTITKAEGFEQSEETVLVNGDTLTAVDGVYTIENIKSNITVSIDGIVPAAINFSVFIDGVEQTIQAQQGQTIQEAVDAANLEVTDYNSCGWYFDENYSQVADMSTVVGVSRSFVTLYTKTVTEEMLQSLQIMPMSQVMSADDLDLIIEKAVSLPQMNGFNSYLSSDTIGAAAIDPNTTLEEIVVPKLYSYDGVDIMIGASLLLPEGTWAGVLKSLVIPTTSFKGAGIIIMDGGYGGVLDPSMIMDIMPSMNMHSNILSLNDLIFPDVDLNKLSNLMIIGYTFFAGKEETIETIKIPDSVVYISDYAFNGLSNLNSVTISDSLKRVGEGVFNNCDSLEIINVSSLESWAKIEFHDNDSNPLFAYSAKLCVNGVEVSGDITLTGSETFTKIGDYAFYGCKNNITSVTIGDGITEIGRWAFYDCSTLQTVNIGSTLSYIDYKAFDSCDLLQIINVTHIENWAQINFYSNYDNPLYGLSAKLYVNNVEVSGDITLTGSETFTKIGDYAFYGYLNITSVTIGDGITSIGSNAFYGCTALKTLNIGDSLLKVDSQVFYGCNLLERINVSQMENWAQINYTNASGNPLTANSNVKLYVNGEELAGNITILGSETFTKIGDYAFYGYLNITSVTIGDGITEIGMDSFCSCDNLQTLHLGNDVKVLEYNSFMNCRDLQTVTVGESVEAIADRSFNGCYKLIEVINYSDLDLESVKGTISHGYIGYYASYITNVTDGNTVQSKITESNGVNYYIDGETKIAVDLADNTITNLVLDSDTTAINQYAFENTNLQTITIPNKLTNIGKYAFNGCKSLTTVYYEGSSQSNITIGSDNTPLTNATWNCDYVIPTEE